MRHATALLALLLAGCHSTCTFRSEPTGAQVWVDGKPAGVTPCNVELEDGLAQVNVRYSKDGYEDLVEVFKQELAGYQTSSQTQQLVGPTYQATPNYGGGSMIYQTSPGMSMTTTTTSPVYAWPEWHSVTLRPAFGTPGRFTKTVAQDRRERGLCVKCGKALGSPGAPFCGECGSKQ